MSELPTHVIEVAVFETGLLWEIREYMKDQPGKFRVDRLFKDHPAIVSSARLQRQVEVGNKVRLIDGSKIYEVLCVHDGSSWLLEADGRHTQAPVDRLVVVG